MTAPLDLRARRLRVLDPVLAGHTGPLGVDGVIDFENGVSRYRVPVLIYRPLLAIATCEDADTGEQLDPIAILDAVWQLPADHPLTGEGGADQVFDPTGAMIARTIYSPEMLRAIYDGARLEALRLPERTGLEALQHIARVHGHAEVPHSFAQAVRIICGVSEAGTIGSYTLAELEQAADDGGLPAVNAILAEQGIEPARSIVQGIDAALRAQGQRYPLAEREEAEASAATEPTQRATTRRRAA